MGVIDVRDDGPLRSLRLTNPIGPNALTAEMVDAIIEAVDVPEAIRVVVLTGSPSVFCSGASAAVLDDLLAGDLEPAELTVPRRMLAAEVVVVAAMAGHAIGGGLVLGLCADVVLFAEESRYGATFMNHGFTPGMGATRLLEKVMAPALAHEMLLGGEPMTGRQLAHGGVPNVLPKDEIEARAEEIALRIADKPRNASVMLKQQLARPWRQAFEEAHPAEAKMHRACLSRLRQERSRA